MIKRILFYVMFVCILFTYSCIGKKEKEAEQKPKPNFVFILVDDLGKEWISAYGATDIETPNIDALASKGIKFNNAYSMPQCTPSRVALLTGKYPYANGWVNHYDVPRWGNGANFDAVQNPTFINELRTHGYRTCIAGKWQINDFRIEPDALDKAGFDDYCMWTGYESGNPASAERYWDPYIFTKEGSKTYKGAFGPDIFSDFVLDFMRDNKESPMCIYYPMVLTHTPFVHTPRHQEAKTKYEKHQAMVSYTDFIVGKLVNGLKEMGLTDNTYLIFTTDNGTVPSIIGSRDDVYVQGGKSYLTENGINAPFLVITPDQLNFETDALIDFTDISETLLELAGIEEPLNPNGSARSFADVLTGKNQKGSKEWILAMGGQPAILNEENRVENYFTFRDRVIRDSRYKVYLDTLKQLHRIFDMKTDPYEQRNLIDTAGLVPILEKFKLIVNALPNEDAQPSYQKTDTLSGNISREDLNRLAKSNQRNSNMMPLSNKEAYVELQNETLKPNKNN
ncbi:sulfatase-like hydrolase/transferase [Flavivirga aquimarina]|uniref:Sulfatase-like hydrolase/transferase n=1 Tax=Flavivirga aquimarina TaxID=2027862 RepID=A0ABT8W6Q3_9FLAO|nr:sulfatase-like hydrolase/transferase [Flavivirga aquimarina]MDO5968754.1 sulfatase-like hydrolase/transferase [Flavivirga aquimarina]